MNILTVYENRSIKTRQEHMVINSIPILYVNVECESFAVISIDSLLSYENKYYLQVYLETFAYKLGNTQMINYLHGNIFWVQ